MEKSHDWLMNEGLSQQRQQLLSLLSKKRIADELAVKIEAQAYDAARRRGVDEYRAWDVAHDAVLFMYQHLDTYLTHPFPDAYIGEVIRWRVIDMLSGRTEGTNRHELTDDQNALEQLVHEHQNDGGSDPVNRAVSKQLLQKIDVTLTPRQRVVLHALVSEGLTSEEMAEEVGTSAPAVRQVLHRTRRKLRRLLDS